MTENTKTAIFVGIAFVALLAGWATKPSNATLDVQSLIGMDLTKDFTDPAEARRLRIVQFNEDTATLREFEVAEENGLWTIPSKSGYPADAERQMAEAATSLMDRRILAVVSESAGDHEQYGVVDPLSPKLEAGQKGVGTHVTISDIHNEPLVDLIIGRAVKDAPGQRYVREGNRDIVYVIEVNPEPLATDFEKWIEKDLLKLNSWDVQEVAIKDYSASLQPVMTPQGQLAIQVAFDPRAEMEFAHDASTGNWTPEQLRAFDTTARDYMTFALAEDEELNEDKLNDLKTALGDLEIVDVARKPAGLSADLKAGVDFLDNPEARQDLRSLGFATVPSRTGEGQELISSEGEVLCTTKDGVEYVLRFGDLRMDTSGETDDGKVDIEAAAAKSNNKNVQRYLFVMARFNEDAIPKPELQELPPLPEGVHALEEEATTETDADGDVEESETAIEEEEEEEEAEEAAESTEAEPAEDAAANQDAELERIRAERKRIEKENQRKLDEYNARLEKGRQKVKDLNLRFGDWYFVVSNDTFQKLRLSRNDVIKKKAPDDDSAGEPASAGGESGLTLPGLPSIPGTQSE